MIIISILPSGKAGVNQLITISDFAIDIQTIPEIHETQRFFTNFQIPLEVLKVFDYRTTENFLRAYKYYALVEVTQEDLIRKEKFLTDYHSIHWIAKESGKDVVSVAEILVAISNLLRLASMYSVDEIHLISMRVFRKYSDTLGKDIFFITEF